MLVKFKNIEIFEIFLRFYNIIGFENVRVLLKENNIKIS